MADTDIQNKLRAFFSHYPSRMYAKCEVLVQAGDTPASYYILEGTISQYDISHTGDKLILNTYKAGAFISLATILNNIPSDLFFEAAEVTNVHVAPSQEVAAFLRENPDVTYDALARLSRGSNGLMLRLARAMEGSAEGRILQELAILRARFGGANGEIAITDSELAAQTGMARETISRALKKLNAKGLVSASRGTIVLHDKHHM
jgi:CRP-like cAMP-binding protein